MISYLIKMALCALLFFMVYFLFLEKENMHRFKRFYLIGSLLFSLLIPFISLEYTSTLFPVWDQYVPTIEVEANENPVPDADTSVNALVISEEITPAPDTKVYILYIYILITVLLLFRYLYNVVQLFILANKHETICYKHAKLVLMNNKYLTFSFWNYIFIQKTQFKKGEIKPEILSHELAHVHQRHTLDVLFIEILTVLFWFNPIIYLYKRSIRLNHEFLADDQVVKETNDITNYQLILLNEINKNNKLELASFFNYLITKKRFIMMTKRTSSKIILWKSSISLLTILTAFCFFSIKIEAQEAKEVIEVTETAIHSDDSYIIPESGITSDEMERYKEIVNKYFDQVKGNKVLWKSKSVSDEDVNTLYPLYIRMTKEQRGEKLFISFTGPLNPLKLRSPNNDEWRSCKNTDNKHIWLDGKEVSSEELNSYNRHNIAYFLVSRKANGENRQSYLWTRKGIEEYQNKYKKQIPLSKLLEIRPIRGCVISINANKWMSEAKK